jgi:hypothetical protein
MVSEYQGCPSIHLPLLVRIEQIEVETIQGSLCRYLVVVPQNDIDSGCLQLAGKVADMSKAKGVAALFLLDGEKDGCTPVKRAYNAMKAGASGVLITRPKGEHYKNLTLRLNSAKDDLPSIEAIDVPVGALRNDQGARQELWTMHCFFPSYFRRSGSIVCWDVS